MNAPPPLVAAARACHLALTTPSAETAHIPHQTVGDKRTLLFFDGGSRGNPGPGGAGTVIVHLGGATLTPRVVWMASVSYASKTTNNIAEYRGLLNGLRYAARCKLLGVHVVGDSNFILTQLRKRKTPRAKHLQGLYTQCRLLADRLMVSSWSHHLRHFNKTADGLANLAMDTKKNTQVTAAEVASLPSRWTSVIAPLQADVDHWMDTHPDQEDRCRASARRGAP
ncbi:hypothetical protein PF007_g27692 [Phytophthora fragariae]|uniref:RNase H type-1 domain-containing protein n=4 Tax=Phytophthora TaxID=4783 RepID=A0A6A3Q4W5_9STRA|nr:hypothetical protein PF007_g27692 [Phytophthora fragariae]